MEAPKRNEERFIKRYLDERLSNSLEGVEVTPASPPLQPPIQPTPCNSLEGVEVRDAYESGRWYEVEDASNSLEGVEVLSPWNLNGITNHRLSNSLGGVEVKLHA